uniref:Uncharacterized protein n=1 Tax=Avena sativa TaxID=4498 RepID=A0ACD5YSQ4_AVESA
MGIPRNRGHFQRGGGRPRPIPQRNLPPSTPFPAPAASSSPSAPFAPDPRPLNRAPVDLSSGSGIDIGAEREPASHEMVCIGSLRALVLRAAAGAGRRRGARVLCGRAVDACVTPRARGFRAVAGARAKMMLDSSDSDSAAPAGQLQLQRRAATAGPQPQDGGYASGGWQREDGKLKCGYSSFRGKRATMEDFYDVKLTEIDGQAVSLFGVFDGHGGSRAAEYLKEHLFENLMKHPKFLTDTKLAISTWRVGGVLAMSRAFGNRLLKPFVVAEPEIQEQVFDGELESLVLASDGLWDAVENEEAVSLAKTEDVPESAARKLTEIAYSRGSADNITCIVVQFHHDKTGG